MKHKDIANAVVRIRQNSHPGVVAVHLSAAVIVALALLLHPSDGFASDVFAGKTVYDKHCVRCHGSDGTPMIPGVPNFSIGEGLQSPEGNLVTSIRTGKNLMPGYDRIISEQDILNVLSYIRTLWR